jgi:undecaprenol kinase
MRHTLQSHHPRRHLNSFKYAVRGIIHAIKFEANFRVEVGIGIAAVFFAVYFKVSSLDWLFLTLAIGMLLSAELINTVVEEFIDHLIHEHHEGVRVIKDLCAGFVLIVALSMLCVLVFIFGPKVYPLLLN